MKHSIHIKLCALLGVTTFVFVAAGAEVVAFVPALGCALMMGAMVWMMVRPGGHGRH